MKLEITKEKVLEAASKCSTAKETLKTLFPEVFEDDKYLDLAKNQESCANFEAYLLPKSTDGKPIIRITTYDDKYRGKAFWLDGDFNWELVVKHDDRLLIPTKK